MGTHFDGLVEVVRKRLDPTDTRLREEVPDVTVPTQAYLEEVLRRAQLYHFDIPSNGLFPRSGMDKAEYDAHLSNYFCISAEQGSDFFMPYPVTAIEDLDSVVIMDPIAGNEFVMTTFQRDENGQVLTAARVALHPPRNGACEIGRSEGIYGLKIEDNDVFEVAAPQSVANEHIAQSAVAFIEEIVYIMDPATFIIEERPVKHRKPGKKRNSKGRPNIFKTDLRPTYKVRSKEEAVRILKTGTDTRIAHPVAGHWRTLHSPYWKERQGQMIPVQQHWRGEGVIVIGRKVYEVHVKNGLATPIPFSKLND